MNELTLHFTEVDGIKTMSSIDLSALCVGDSKDAHSNFMKKAAKVIGIFKLVKFYEDVSYEKGTRKILNLPEREACLMAMSYSYELQARVYDAWRSLNKPSWIANLSPQATMALEDLNSQLELAAPKVAFVDDYVKAKTGSMTFRQFCKMLPAKENEFRKFLVDNHIMYSLNGNWSAYAEHLNAKRFEVKAGVANDHSYSTAYFTPKGVEWVAGQYAKFQLSVEK